MTTLNQLRTQAETDIAGLLRKLNSDRRDSVLAAIERYGSVADVPESFWEELKQAIDSDIAAILLLLMVPTYTNMTNRVARIAPVDKPIEKPTEDQIRTAAAERAASIGRQAAVAHVDYTRSRLETAWQNYQSRADQIDARKQLEADVADIMPTRPDPEKLTAPDTTAITSTTRGISDAEIAGARDEGARRGVQVDVRWVTEKDSKVCPVCSPLNGKPSIEWVDQFPSGPPAHPNCRCRLAPYVQGDNDGGDTRPTDARREPALPYSILPGETNPL